MVRARFALLLALLASPWTGGGLGCGSAPEIPSILLVSVDTLRADHVGAYGARPSPTPSIDRLAEDGLVYDFAYTTMPTTSPAHASLFTGLHPHEHGVRRNGIPLSPDLSDRALALRLSTSGFATAAFVSSQVLARRATGFAGGFDVYDEPGGPLRPGIETVEAALAWLKARERRPVFLFLHLYDPHSPYGASEEKRARIPVDPGRYGFVDRRHFPDADSRERMVERYERGVRDADAAIGAFLAGASGLIEDPLVILVADHGEALDEHLETRGYAFDHGEYLDPEQIRIPLILRGPGVSAGRSAMTVSIRDLYVTILGAAGRADPPDAEGLDLRAPPAEDRTALVARRALAPWLHRNLAEDDPAGVRAHAVAAARGERVVILPAQRGLADAGALLEAGLDHGVAVRRARAADPAGIDPRVEAHLRSLGYVQ